MELTKSMIRVLIAVINGSDSLEKLQDSLEASKSWAARIVKRLEKEKFIEKSKKGISMKLHVSSASHAQSFREMYFSKPYRKYESVLTGRNLDVLLAIAYSPKSTKVISGMLGVQARAVRPRLRNLGNQGLILKEKGKYGLSRTDIKIARFLSSARAFSQESGSLLWKFKNEQLMKARRREDVKGALTGFSSYADYGVEMQTAAYACYTGKTKLSSELVFIHSLFEVEDARTLGLALTFYSKNKLYKKLKKLRLLAEKFDVPERLREVEATYEKYKTAEGIISNRHIPSIGVMEIRRQFELYGVKNV